jgi:hypothetical protein
MYGKQMELFEDGGLRDQGETRDPMSGNNVPVGSTQKEVRDDIPAMLSEGEFVLPADVVRYIGLDRLMKMRQDAKQGLENMNRMGQFGNSHEATIPDTLPYNQISPMAQQQMAQGGVPQGYHRMPDGRIMANSAHMNQGGMGTVGQQFQLLGQQTGGNQPEMIYGKSKSNLGVSQGASFVEYIDPETFERVSIRTIDGVPQEEVPEGYIPLKQFLDTLEPEDRAYFEENGELPPETLEEYADEFGINVDEEEEIVDEETITPTGGDGGGSKPPEKTEFQKAGSWQMDTSATDGNALQMWIDEAEKVVNFGGITSGVVTAIGGGPLGALVHFSNKHQKKTILEMIDSKIEQARQTPIEGQVAALQELKAKLEGTTEKTGISGVIEGIINTIGDALGLTDNEKEKVKNVAEKENNNAPSSDVTAEMDKPVEPTPDPSDAAYANLLGETDVAPSSPTISIDPEEDSNLFPVSVRDPEEDTQLFPEEFGAPTILEDSQIPTLGGAGVGFGVGEGIPADIEMEALLSADKTQKEIEELGFTSLEQAQNLLEQNALSAERAQRLIREVTLNEKTREMVEKAEEFLVEQNAATPEIERRVAIRKQLNGILEDPNIPKTAMNIATGITPEIANQVSNYLVNLARTDVTKTLTTGQGERASVAQQRNVYYKAQEEKERLARLAAEAAARAKRARDAEAKRRAEEEAKRLNDEAAKKAAEEAEALGGKSKKQVLYESLDPDVQTEVAASDEQIVMSQPVRNNNDDDGPSFPSTGGTSFSTPSVTDYSGSTFEEKVSSQGEDLAAAAGSTKKEDGSYDISSWFKSSKGGLAKPVFKSVRKPDTARGLAARKK